MKMKCNMDMINSVLLVVILLGLLYYYKKSNEKFSAGSWLGINICQLDKDLDCIGKSDIEELQKKLKDEKKKYSDQEWEELIKRVSEELKLKEQTEEQKEANKQFDFSFDDSTITTSASGGGD